MASRPKSREDFGIAVLCALPLEFNSVDLITDQSWYEGGDIQYGKAPGDPNIYSYGRIGKTNVVHVLLPGMGKVNAATATVWLRNSFPRLKHALLTGICGGVPFAEGKEVLLGDVIISQAVHQFDFGRRYADGFVAKDDVKDALSKPAKAISNLLRRFQTDSVHDSLESCAASALELLQKRAGEKGRAAKYRYPGAQNDRIFTRPHKHQTPRECAVCFLEPFPCQESRTLSCDKIGCESIPLAWRKRLERKMKLQDQDRIREAQAPGVFVGDYGSADMVLRSSKDRDELATRYGLLAFEMESAGCWDEIPCIVIKGICDYADSHKNKEWQDFAAATAASVLRTLLEGYISYNPSSGELCFTLCGNSSDITPVLTGKSG